MKLAASSRTPALVGSAASDIGVSTLRSAVELWPGLQDRLPELVVPGPGPDYHVEVVPQLGPVVRVVLEHGADELACEVLPADGPVPEVVGVQRGGVSDRDGLG